MALTYEIPETAMSVVELIRKDVPKPKHEDFKSVTTSVHQRPCLRHEATGCCPLGMLPYATRIAPTTDDHFTKPVLHDAVVGFFFWWDRQDDAEAAVNAVWGEV